MAIIESFSYRFFKGSDHPVLFDNGHKKMTIFTDTYYAAATQPAGRYKGR